RPPANCFANGATEGSVFRRVRRGSVLEGAVNMLKRLCASVSLIVAIACSKSTPTAPSQTPPPQTFSLSGRVTDNTTSTPIVGATLSIADGPNAGKSAMSDASGNYTFTGLQQSGFTVTASARTYLSQSKSVTLTANQTLDFTLQSTPPPGSQF